MDGEGVGRGAWEPRAGRMKGRGMDRSSLKRKLAVLAVLTGVALIAAGCSKSSTPSTTDSSSASGTSAAPAKLNVELGRPDQARRPEQGGPGDLLPARDVLRPAERAPGHRGGHGRSGAAELVDRRPRGEHHAALPAGRQDGRGYGHPQ